MSTPFQLFLCGPRVRVLEDAMPAVVEELGARGLGADVVAGADGATTLGAVRTAVGGGRACVALLEEPSADAREALFAQAPAAVVVAWEDGGAPGFEPVSRPHLAVPAGADVAPALVSIVELLEGLGYLGPPARGALSDGEDAALLAGLKDLGYA